MAQFNFSGKKVAILGLSIEGIDSARFFLSQGAEVTCCDRRTAYELGEIVTQLRKSGAHFQLGPTYLAQLSRFDLLIRTPGMYLHLQELIEYQKAGHKISSQTKLLLHYAPCDVIGVTGTKGKGTTATLIAQLLRTTGRAVHLGGNVGVPLLSQLPQFQAKDLVILELSSFQLEDVDVSPHVAVVLTTGSDHLATSDPLSTNYHLTKEAYVQAKKNIVRFQKSMDICILNADDPVSRSFATDTHGQIRTFSTRGNTSDAGVKDGQLTIRVGKENQPIIKTQDIKIKGKHNWENVLAAILVASEYHVPYPVVARVVKDFQGLEHRLEEVRTISGTTFFNDSFSTTPETTIAALAAFTTPIILIIGGSEKGADFTELARTVAVSRVKLVIAIGDIGSKIASALKTYSPHTQVRTGISHMQKVVEVAFAAASPGDTVLLSPAAASFGLFKNYKDRGAQFKKYVQALTSKTHH